MLSTIDVLQQAWFENIFAKHAKTVNARKHLAFSDREYGSVIQEHRVDSPLAAKIRRRVLPRGRALFRLAKLEDLII
ncbi:MULTISPECIES: hypothetical protein [Shewanella]|uniref:hypothetical protein n=1 Tax=Shewanella TaxID=22 RepID=UPI003007EB7B